jgi:glucose-1-phosphate cytidylyltransferase
MVEIGYRPLVWHLMRYYAHYGHNEFILCLGYRGDAIKKYFLNYDECLSNDFVLTNGGREVRLYNNDIEDWTISFVDTGIHTNIGQRLLAVREHVGEEDVFMANYADGLTDLDLAQYLDFCRRQNRIATFLSVRPSQSFHVVSLREDGRVANIEPVSKSDIWINGGFFVFKKEIFDYIRDGEDLVREPFYRLITENQLVAYKNPGFWACVDTLAEKKMFDDMYARGETPWTVWESSHRENKHRILVQAQRAADVQAIPDGGMKLAFHQRYREQTYVE